MLHFSLTDKNLAILDLLKHRRYSNNFTLRLKDYHSHKTKARKCIKIKIKKNTEKKTDDKDNMQYLVNDDFVHFGITARIYFTLRTFH